MSSFLIEVLMFYTAVLEMDYFLWQINTGRAVCISHVSSEKQNSDPTKKTFMADLLQWFGQKQGILKYLEISVPGRPLPV